MADLENQASGKDFIIYISIEDPIIRRLVGEIDWTQVLDPVPFVRLEDALGEVRGILVKQTEKRVYDIYLEGRVMMCVKEYNDELIQGLNWKDSKTLLDMPSAQTDSVEAIVNVLISLYLLTSHWSPSIKKEYPWVVGGALSMQIREDKKRKALLEGIFRVVKDQEALGNLDNIASITKQIVLGTAILT